MKKSKLFLAGMAALLLSFGLVLAGCPTEDDGDGGGGDPSVTISGTPTVGQTLTATFSGLGSDPGIEWYVVDSADATSNSYLSEGSTYTISNSGVTVTGKFIRAKGHNYEIEVENIWSNAIGPIVAAE